MAFAEATTRVIERGLMPVRITLSAACSAGDLLGYSSGWKPADGNGTIYAELVAAEKGANGDTITAYRAAVISGYTGGTAGGILYLSDTAGGVSDAAGTVAQVVGFLLSATMGMLVPAYNIGGQIIPAAVKLFFRDSGLYVHSSADGKLTISADGTGTDDIILDGTVTINDDVILATGKDVQVVGTGELQAPADKIKAGSIIVPQRVVVTSGLIDATNDVDRIIFVADRAYEVVSVVERNSVIEATGNSSDVMIEKVPSGTAIGSGTDILAAAVNLKTGVTLNTNTTLALHATQANYQLATGNALALDFTNALTEYVGSITITLKAI